MWKNVGKRPRRPREAEFGEEEDEQRVHRMSVDCTGSSRGLFLGILVMVGTIISIIAFYMLIKSDDAKVNDNRTPIAVYTRNRGEKPGQSPCQHPVDCQLLQKYTNQCLMVLVEEKKFCCIDFLLAAEWDLFTTQCVQLSSIILTHLSETAIYIVTLIALFLAACRMKTLTFNGQHEADLEDILILISYTGLLAFIIFSLVASILSKPTTTTALTIMSNVVMLIQATVQTIFMLAGDRLSASSEVQERKKPGREFITFLLISNFAMWAINTFETQTPQHNPIQVEFYGPEAWAIFTHISVPLGIYYRFHSTVCFSNIWKNAWKKRKH